jgi:hypothetical protein
MTVLEQMVQTVAVGDADWAQFVTEHTTASVPSNATEWGRKGGSFGKEGEFFKK